MADSSDSEGDPGANWRDDDDDDDDLGLLKLGSAPPAASCRPVEDDAVKGDAGRAASKRKRTSSFKSLEAAANAQVAVVLAEEVQLEKLVSKRAKKIKNDTAFSAVDLVRQNPSRVGADDRAAKLEKEGLGDV